MIFEEWETGAFSLAILQRREVLINDASDFLDLVGNSPHRIVLVYKEQLHPDFFDLKTGIAGEILQKSSNYGFRLGILGDHKGYKSKAFNDFIRESNRTGQVVFASNKEESAALMGVGKGE